MTLKANVSKWSRSDWKWVVLALLAIAGVALIAAWALQQYDETRGFQREADRIAELLEIGPGMVVGDVRAGSGRWSVDLARRVGEEGQVYATAGPSPPHELYQTVADSGLDNITVIVRTPGETGRLPVDCCDAILLRLVFHHFEDRPTFANTLYQDAKPGGRLLVIDFGRETPQYATGHGIPMEHAIEEITGAGFQLEQTIEDWGSGSFCLLFRKPPTAPPPTPPS